MNILLVSLFSLCKGISLPGLFCMYIYDALRDLVPFVQFKKREKHPWRMLLLVELQCKIPMVECYFLAKLQGFSLQLY